MTRKYPSDDGVRRVSADQNRVELRIVLPGGAGEGSALLNREDGLRFGPVLLEAVVLAFRRREDVDDDRPEVDQDPVRRRGPLAPDRLRALVSEAADDAAGDRLELPFGSAGADDEVVGHGRQPAKVEQDDVGCLLILGKLDDAAREP